MKGAACTWLAALGIASSAWAGSVSVGANASLDLGTGSLALGCADLDVLGTMSAGVVGFTQGRDVAIDSNGTLNGNSATLELSGDWDNQGTFVAGTSTVRMVDGCGLLSAVVSGKSSFHNFEVISAGGKQIRFEAKATQQVTNLLSFAGVLGSLLQIRSTVDGTPAYLEAAGASSATFVDVQDNDATPGGPIALGSDSVKGSNTPGW
ncbi:MAG TPA: hypothetical protein VFZ65_06710, partial [Planctomycetota bacterium]|nr:hypothetical protein [Planctomycetota bacterium]